MLALHNCSFSHDHSRSELDFLSWSLPMLLINPCKEGTCHTKVNRLTFLSHIVQIMATAIATALVALPIADVTDMQHVLTTSE
jgi:hypothetical protein